MDFLIFSAADVPLFERDDAESAHWTVEEYSLVAEFPYKADKELQRGQRIGFTDETGVFQPFEIRKVETMEPDHYQRITAEHIVVSELSDEHIYNTEITDDSIETALTGVLDGTLWEVGTVGDQTVQSADISTGSVWQAIRALEGNYNVYITPRVTFDTSGITGRYLDIAPAGGVWRGVRLSLDKNADEVGVVYDDTDLITAMYGYGKMSDSEPLTFEDEVWTATADHPAKPDGQAYLVNPDALAAYGRNGRNRWGYYQNGNISSASVLLEKTWEALKQASQPTVSIDCLVRDLYRMGYADQPIRLHDIAYVDIEPIGTELQLEIIRLEVDLLDPTATRPTIGAYIPNIVYINRETASRGGGGGGGGGRGQSNKEAEISEFETEIYANQYEIGLRAYQRDMTNVESILKESGVAVEAGGTIIYANNNLTDMKSDISVNANKIGLVVQGTGSNASIKAASIVAAINDASSSVTISADHIVLDGAAVATALTSQNVIVGTLTAGATTLGTLTINGNFTLPSGYIFSVGGTTYQQKLIRAGSESTLPASYVLGNGSSALELDHYHSFTVDSSTGVITIGAPSSTAGSFNIADTTKYQTDVAAAQTTGWNNAAAAMVWPSSGTTAGATFTYPTSGGGTAQKAYVLTNGSWSSGSLTVRMREGSASGTTVADTTVNMPSSATISVRVTGPSGASGSWSATVTVGGKTYTNSGSWMGSN